jgi:hypothetical protein
MLPTWRDVELQNEIRQVRIQEAANWHILSQLPGRNDSDLSAHAILLVRLGDWMVRAGEKLQSQYSDAGQVDHKLRSLEQGC